MSSPNHASANVGEGPVPDRIDDLIDRAKPLASTGSLAELDSPDTTNDRRAVLALFSALGEWGMIQPHESYMPLEKARNFLPALRARGVATGMESDDEELMAQHITAAVIAATIPALARYIDHQRFLATRIWRFVEPAAPPAQRVRGQVEPAAIYGGTIDDLVGLLTGEKNSLPYWGEVSPDGNSATEGWVTDPVIMLNDTTWVHRMGELGDHGWGGQLSSELKWAVKVLTVKPAKGSRLHPIATVWYARPEFRSHVAGNVLPFYRCLAADSGDPDYQPGNMSWMLEHGYGFEQRFAIG